VNIFVLDANPHQAARDHCDKHVVKMVLETAQLLCTAHHVLDGDAVPSGLCKPTHRMHPCAVWARKCSANYAWLTELFDGLLREYAKRYGRTHACSKFAGLLPPRAIRNGDLTPFAQCMPEAYRQYDPVAAYRNYYLNDKSYMATWRTQVPLWWRDDSN